MLRVAALIGLIGLAGCRPDPELQRDVADLRSSMQAHDRELAKVEEAVARLSDQWADVVEAYQAVSAQYQAARASFVEAEQHYATASRRYKSAAKTWAEAEFLWKVYKELVFIAVAIDAANLEASRTRLEDFSCEPVSTGKFRRMLEAAGRSLDGMHIDHIVPRNLGGADHPSNYRVVPARENLEWSDTWNRDKCRTVGAKSCAHAVGVSRECGSYRGVIP